MDSPKEAGQRAPAPFSPGWSILLGAGGVLILACCGLLLALSSSQSADPPPEELPVAAMADLLDVLDQDSHRGERRTVEVSKNENKPEDSRAREKPLPGSERTPEKPREKRENPPIEKKPIPVILPPELKIDPPPTKEKTPPALEKKLILPNPETPPPLISEEKVLPEKTGKRLLAWSGELEVKTTIFVPTNPLWKALEARGYKVRQEFGEFQAHWLEETDQLWIFSGQGKGTGKSNRELKGGFAIQRDAFTLTATDYKAIEKWARQGKGLYLAADNTPYTTEANVLAGRLFRVSIQGNYSGMKIALFQGRPRPDPKIVGHAGFYRALPHPLLAGVNSLHEGVTVSAVSPSPYLETALRASDGNTLLAVSRSPKLRVVLDGGWTRYEATFIGMTEPGNLRLAQNIAAFLEGKEKDKKQKKGVKR